MPDMTGGAVKIVTGLAFAAAAAAPGAVQSHPFWAGHAAQAHSIVGSTAGGATGGAAVEGSGAVGAGAGSRAAVRAFTSSYRVHIAASADAD